LFPEDLDFGAVLKDVEDMAHLLRTCPGAASFSLTLKLALQRFAQQSTSGPEVASGVAAPDADALTAEPSDPSTNSFGLQDVQPHSSLNGGVTASPLAGGNETAWDLNHLLGNIEIPSNWQIPDWLQSTNKDLFGDTLPMTGTSAMFLSSWNSNLTNGTGFESFQ
jgi:hypothetical protein